MADCGTAIKDLADLAWPTIIFCFLYYYKEQIKGLLQAIREKNFSFKIGSIEVSFSDAANQLGKELSDLRNEYNEFKIIVSGEMGLNLSEDVSLSRVGQEKINNILWVDDNPSNNAYFINDLHQFGVNVICKKSTDDGCAALRCNNSFDMIITDMHRYESGASHEKAGIDLVKCIREQSKIIPIAINCSKWSVDRYGQEAKAAGADLVTNSPTKLMAFILHSKYSRLAAKPTKEGREG